MYVLVSLVWNWSVLLVIEDFDNIDTFGLISSSHIPFCEVPVRHIEGGGAPF